MLQRDPRGLTWGPEVFRELNAPAHIQANPPKLDNAEIHKFRIGNEPDPSRTNAPDSILVRVGDLSNHPPSIHQSSIQAYRRDHLRPRSQAARCGRTHSCPVRSAGLAAAAVGAPGDQAHSEHAFDRDDGPDGPGDRQRDGLGLAQQQEAHRPRLPADRTGDRLHVRACLRGSCTRQSKNWPSGANEEKRSRRRWQWRSNGLVAVGRRTRYELQVRNSKSEIRNKHE